MKMDALLLERWSQAIAEIPETRLDFECWMESELAKLISFKSVICCHGEILAGRIKITHLLALNHQKEYLEQLSWDSDIKNRSSLGYWLTKRQPIFIDPEQSPNFASEFEINEIRAFNLGCVAAHGVLNKNSTAGTYFSFSGMQHTDEERCRAFLYLVTPTLSEIFMSTVVTDTGQLASKSLESIPQRQSDIIALVADGFDNKTVALRLGLSEKTVRNQLTTIFARFGVSSRTELLKCLK